MMTGRECTEVYEVLAKYLREHNLEWVLEQVTEQVRFGAEEKKRVRVGSDVPWSEEAEQVRSRHSNVMFAATRPYREDEKLTLLIDAIRQAVVNTTEMAVSFTSDLAALELPRRGVLVREELDPRLIEIAEHPDTIRYEAAQRLGDLLSELRKEVLS